MQFAEFSAAMAGVQATSELSGFCEVANPYPATLAWERLYPIIDAKIRRARQVDCPMAIGTAYRNPGCGQPPNAASSGAWAARS